MTGTGMPAGRESVRQSVRTSGVVAILRLRAHEHALAVAETLAEAGIRVMEVTLDHPDSTATLSRLRAALGNEVLLGAGTIRTSGDLDAAVSAGARFCVSPGVDADLVRSCLQLGIKPLPGACTATEVGLALDAGARLVKLFPAGPLGQAYLSALQGPFRDTWLVPTGGISHTQVGGWIGAGATAVALGSDLVPARPTCSDLDGIAHRARSVRDQVDHVRGIGGE